MFYRSKLNITSIAKSIIIMAAIGLIATIYLDNKMAKQRLINSIFRPVGNSMPIGMMEYMEMMYKHVPNSLVLAFANDADTIYSINLDTATVIIFKSIFDINAQNMTNILNPKSWTTSRPYFMNQADLTYDYPEGKNGTTWEIDGVIRPKYKCGNRLSISLDQKYWNYVFTYRDLKCFRVRRIVVGDALYASIEVLDPSD